jgi:hypothetical protein
MNIEDTLAPNSDQLDAIELVSGPRVFTVERVTKGNAEQPVNVHLVEFPRPWRPGKSMRRVLAACWGVDASKWIGRRVELFFDPEVTFGKEKPGGTRIKRISHIDKAQRVPLLVTRGKSTIYNVEPLRETAPTPSPTANLLAEIKAAAEAAGVDLATVAAEWAESHEGQAIREATDVGGLELFRDDLRGRVS